MYYIGVHTTEGAILGVVCFIEKRWEHFCGVCKNDRIDLDTVWEADWWAHETNVLKELKSVIKLRCLSAC